VTGGNNCCRSPGNDQDAEGNEANEAGGGNLTLGSGDQIHPGHREVSRRKKVDRTVPTLFWTVLSLVHSIYIERRIF
jgi:hypothetical protein